MLAGETRLPFSNNQWIFEIKWDGYRAIAKCGLKHPLLYSRNAVSFEEKYPKIYNAVRAITTKMVLDGEIVVFDENGNPNFQKLQYYSHYEHLPMYYYVFDILQYKGKEVMDLPLLERKALLKKVLPESDVIRYCDHVENDGEAFFTVMQQRNMEGMIAKLKTSVYIPGTRTNNWLKIKHQRTEEVVIAGYTAPKGARQFFGAVVLGKYENGKLVYVGHSGTGFDKALLKELFNKFQSYITHENPFGKWVPVNNGVIWLKPHFVANIRYSELTREGIVRHPVFQGLREDKTTEDMKKGNTSAANKNDKQSTPAEHATVTPPVKTKVELTHLDKIYWPDEQITKGDLINYYNAVYDYIIPYLRNRPQSMKRTPNGIAGQSFFQKDVKEIAPDWAKTIILPADNNEKEIEYLLCNDKDTLLYMANLGCIEINPWNSTINHLDNPDYVVLDLDPSEKNSFEEVITTANIIKELTDKVGAAAYCKTSGSTGLHIYIPLHAKYTYDESRLFAELIANLAAQQIPEIATVERSLNKRHDKLYIDFLQNKKGQTLAAPYSARPKPGATVSMPLEWREVKPGLQIADFTIKNALQRIEQKGDLFKPVLGKGINLEGCIKKIEKL
ncbi:DNA ligase D [Ilyomonas limi]|uniref:DNA ligase (ATP) n=1 Tax=Ilyomonas limi TaxID=2575867 RepID=A0A4U3L230_9BACT|nr:DNA ligase D [Ilyomonas limi]TKK68902.1 DNA ligase D [Ilyomonas limi]